MQVRGEIPLKNQFVNDKQELAEGINCDSELKNCENLSDSSSVEKNCAQAKNIFINNMNVQDLSANANETLLDQVKNNIAAEQEVMRVFENKQNNVNLDSFSTNLWMNSEVNDSGANNFNELQMNEALSELKNLKTKDDGALNSEQNEMLQNLARQKSRTQNRVN